MNKGSWGKIRAFFDLRTEEGFTMKGFKLVEGINGLFVGFPSQKGSDDEYHDTVWADRDVKELVNQIAIKTYGQEVKIEPSFPISAKPSNTSRISCFLNTSFSSLAISQQRPPGRINSTPRR